MRRQRDSSTYRSDSLLRRRRERGTLLLDPALIVAYDMLVMHTAECIHLKEGEGREGEGVVSVAAVACWL